MDKTAHTGLQGPKRQRSAEDQGQDPTPYPPSSLATDLPEELWCNIFFHCLPTDEFIRPSCTSAPLLLCQVCRTWRAYAIGMSDLWASISIGDRHSREVGRFPRLELVKIWLSRGKTRPLSISYGRIPPRHDLGPSWDEDEQDVEETYEIFELLICHIARWKSLRLCPNEIVEDSLPPIPESGAPLLQHLRLVLLRGAVERDYEFSNCDLGLYDIWRNSMLLRTFSLFADKILVHGDMGSLCESLHIRWGQLTILIIIARQTIKQCLEFLKECPNLVECTFKFILADNYDDDDNDDILSTLHPTPILLASLESLFLGDSGFTESITSSKFLIESLLVKTKMPALRRLIFRAVEVFSPDSFTTFIRHSSCHIEDLTLYGVMRDACLLQFLELLSQTLIRLCIRPSSTQRLKWITDPIMYRLTRDEKSTSPATSILCPKLESIDLDYRALNARYGLFSKMVSSRLDVEEYGITTLKKVFLIFRDEVAIACSQDVSALKKLKEEGSLGELRVEKIGWDRMH